MAAIDQDVPANVLIAALYTRFRSREQESFADKVLSALRKQFGGHVERARGAEAAAHRFSTSVAGAAQAPVRGAVRA